MTDHKGRDYLQGAANRRRGALFAGKRMWVILVLGAVGITALAVLGSMKTKGSTAASAALSTFTARKDNLTITVTESGSINARNTIDIECQVEAGRMGGGVGGGGVTILSIVPEGTYITPKDVNDGKILVELDSSVLEEQIEQYRIDVESAKASFTEANEAHLIQVKQNESDITAAELNVKFAKMDFQKYLGEELAEEVIRKLEESPDSNVDVASLLENAPVDLGDPNDPNDPDQQGGEASQRLKELMDAILLADGQRQKNLDVLAGTRKLYDANYASALDLKTAQLDLQRFQVQTQSAEEALRLYRRYDFPKEAEKFLSDYQEAKRELDRTLARARSMLAQAQARLLSAKARYDLQDERLQKAERQIAACLIKAPAPGLVVYASSSDIFMRRGPGGGGGSTRRTIAEGETVYERQKLITLPDTAEMIAEIAVHETEVDKVRPGQRAVITVDPFPDETFKGRVLKVAQLPDASRGFLNPDLKVYTTQVLIEGTYDYLKPGMSAKVEILVQQLTDVIIVPVTVVANRQGKKVCFVFSPSGSVEERIVKTGAFDDTFVQIVEGLQEGERVLLNPPRITETGGGYESRGGSDRFESDQPGAPPAPAGPQPGEVPQPGVSPGQEERGQGGRRQRGPRSDDGTPGGGRFDGGAAPGGQGESRGERTFQGPGGPGGRGGPGGGFQPSDEMLNRMLDRLAESDPAKANELRQLKESDPEKFSEELRKTMTSMFGGMRRGGQGGRGGGGQGGRGGNAGPGQDQ